MAGFKVANNALDVVQNVVKIAVTVSAPEILPLIGPLFGIAKGILGLSECITTWNEPDQWEKLERELQKISEQSEKILEKIEENHHELLIDPYFVAVKREVKYYHEQNPYFNRLELYNNLNSMQEKMIGQKSWIKSWCKICQERSPATDATWGLAEAIQQFLAMYGLQGKAISVLKKSRSEEQGDDLKNFIYSLEKQMELFWNEFINVWNSSAGEMKPALPEECIKDYEDSKCWGDISDNKFYSLIKNPSGKETILQTIDFTDFSHTTKVIPDMDNYKKSLYKMLVHNGEVYTVHYPSKKLCSINPVTTEIKSICESRQFDGRSQMVISRSDDTIRLYAVSKRAKRTSLCKIDPGSSNDSPEASCEDFPTSDYSAALATIDGDSKLYALAKGSHHGWKFLPKKSAHSLYVIDPSNFEAAKPEVNPGCRSISMALTGHGTHLYAIDNYKIVAYDTRKDYTRKELGIIIPEEISKKNYDVHLMRGELTLYLQVNGDKNRLYLIKPYWPESPLSFDEQSASRASCLNPGPSVGQQERERSSEETTANVATSASDRGKVDRSLTTQTTTPPSPEMSYYRNYLKSFYNTNPVPLDDKLSIAPCSEFISLALVKKDESVSNDDAFSKSTFYGGRDQISAHKVPLELNGILTSESKFVLVEGAPGIGKSTLSWELCRKWDTLKCLQHYSVVLLLKLREGRVQNASSLNELFYHRDRALCESVVSEVLRCEGEGVLLILDGFDEMPASVVRNKESLIMEIISGTCIPRATRLVTSRPSALHHTKCFPRGFRHVEIVGFTDENIEKFAEIAFKSEPNVLSEFKKFIFSNPIIKSLMYIPVNCAILAQSYKDIMRSSKQVPKTTTQLYSMLTRILIRRHLIAIGRWDEYSKVPRDLKDLPKDVKGDLKRVSKLAYTGLFKEDVQLVFTDSDVGEGFHPLGLLSEVKEMYVCEGARTSYSFLHLSIQEFLAAWHVSCHHKSVKEALDKTLHRDRARLHVFGHMLAGLSGISDSYKKNLMMWNMYNNERLLYACHCFYEAQINNSSNIFDNASSGISLYTPLDMYVFGYCLAYVAHQWSCVDIDSSVDMLVSNLADHASNEVLGSIETLNLCRSSSSSTCKLKDLPHSLLCSIKKIMVGILLFPLLEGMPVLPCVQEFIFRGTQAGHSWSILKKFPNLKVLRVTLNISERICELTKAIASHSNMEEIVLHMCIFHKNDYEYNRLDSLAQAALSCPSLKRLDTDYPFVVSNNASPKNIQNIKITGFEESWVTELPMLIDCFYNIPSVCKVSPVQSIEYSLLNSPSISLSLLPCDCVGGYYDCISLLNVCLHHHWPSMEELQLPFSIPCTQFHLSSLSRALRRDPDTSQLKLRRSKSLSDLVCLKTLDEHARKHCTAPYSRSNPQFRDIKDNHTAIVKKTESCPDLVGIQSLHPLMAEKLFELDSLEVCRVSSDDSSVSTFHNS